jgi:hypothetical protein
MDKREAINKVKAYKLLLKDYFRIEKDFDKAGFLGEIKKYGIEIA